MTMRHPRKRAKPPVGGGRHMSESGGGTASGDYDNETASLIEKRLERKRKEAELKAKVDEDSEVSEASLDTWENDGGRRSDELPKSPTSDS